MQSKYALSSTCQARLTTVNGTICCPGTRWARFWSPEELGYLLASPSPTSRIWRVTVRGWYPAGGTPNPQAIQMIKTELGFEPACENPNNNFVCYYCSSRIIGIGYFLLQARHARRRVKKPASAVATPPTSGPLVRSSLISITGKPHEEY